MRRRPLTKIPQHAPYNPRAANVVCFAIATGETLGAAALLAGLTTDLTIYQWLLDVPEFATAYDRAKQIRAHRIFDGLLSLADTATNENHNAVRLQIDTRKWVLGKMLPREYGDKITAELGIAQSLEQLVLDSIRLQNKPEGEETEFKKARTSQLRAPGALIEYMTESLPEAAETAKSQKKSAE